MEYAHKHEIMRLDEDIAKTREMLKKFVLKTDYAERFKNVEREIWTELALKIEKKAVDNSFEAIKDATETE